MGGISHAMSFIFQTIRKLRLLLTILKMFLSCTGILKKLKRRLEESWKFSEKENYIFEENIRSTLFNEGSRIKMKLKWPMNKYAQMFLKEVMNNKNESIGEILAKASTVFNEPKDFLLEEFRTIYTAAKSSGQMLLRHKDVPEFEKTQNNILYELY